MCALGACQGCSGAGSTGDDAGSDTTGAPTTTSDDLDGSDDGGGPDGGGESSTGDDTGMGTPACPDMTAWDPVDTKVHDIPLGNQSLPKIAFADPTTLLMAHVFEPVGAGAVLEVLTYDTATGQVGPSLPLGAPGVNTWSESFRFTHGGGHSSLLWQQVTESDRSLWLSHYLVDEDRWTEPFLVAGGPELGEIDAVTGPDGSVVVAWREPINDSAEAIRARRYDGETRTWGPTAQLNDGLTLDHHPSLGVDAAGNVVLIYVAGRYIAEQRLWSARLPVAAAAWTPAAPLPGRGHSLPKLAVAPDGSAWVAGDIWMGSEGASLLHVFRGRTDGDVWSEPVPIDPEGPHDSDALCVGPGGHGHLSWVSGVYPDYVIRTARLEAGEGTWTAPTTHDWTMVRPGRPRMVCGARGDAVLTWADGGGSSQGVLYAARFDGEALAWGEWTPLESPGARVTPNDLALSPDGCTAAVAWKQYLEGDLVVETPHDLRVRALR